MVRVAVEFGGRVPGLLVRESRRDGLLFAKSAIEDAGLKQNSCSEISLVCPSLPPCSISRMYTCNSDFTLNLYCLK